MRIGPQIKKGIDKRYSNQIIPAVARSVTRAARDYDEANMLYEGGDFTAALGKAELALAEDPTLLKAQYLRIQLLGSMGHTEEAQNLARDLLDKHPLVVSLHRHALAVGVEPKRPTLVSIIEMIRSAPAPLSLVQFAMEYLHFQERFEEAIHIHPMGQLVANRDPHKKKTRSTMQSIDYFYALSLEGANRYQEAIAVHRTLLSGSISERGAASIARCLLEQEKPEDAYNALTAAAGATEDTIQYSPLMLDILQARGRVGESYKFYRRRPVSVALSEFFSQPDPSNIDISHVEIRNKRVLLISEGGPGDELRFSSFYDELSDILNDLTITCDPRLLSVLERSFPRITFLPAERKRREFVKKTTDRTLLTDMRLFQCVNDDIINRSRDADIVCSVLDSLANIRPHRKSFRARPRSLVKVLPELQAAWSKHLSGGKMRVGIAWRSLLRSVARNRHYLTVEELAPLAALEGVEFWSLQPGLDEEERLTAEDLFGLKVPDGLDLKDDFEGQIAFASLMDVIVSPFTTTGEIGGAVGTPTVLIATTGNTIWRREPDGCDLFSSTTTIVRADDLHDKGAALRCAADQIRVLMATGRPRGA